MIASTQKIIESIKLTGEQLIKDAEMIAGDFYAHQILNIDINIDLENGAIPTICINSEYTPEAYLKKAAGFISTDNLTDEADSLTNEYVESQIL